MQTEGNIQTTGATADLCRRHGRRLALAMDALAEVARELGPVRAECEALQRDLHAAGQADPQFEKFAAGIVRACESIVQGMVRIPCEAYAAWFDNVGPGGKMEGRKA